MKNYAFVYDELVYFPKSDIHYETFTTKNFFIHVHRLIKMKVHLHHSHITGKIIGYSHNFCNTSVVDKTSPDIPVIAYNLFGFDLYYFIKGYIASVWYSKSLNIAGNNLTQINFSSIAGEIKFISLAELASTFSVEEKLAVKELTTNFLNQHYYFSTAWPYLNSQKKKKILEIVSEGKGFLPYEMIIDMQSLFITPEKDFWEKNRIL